MTENAWTGTHVRVRAIEAADWEVFHALDEDTEAARLGHFIPAPRSPAGSRKWAEEKAAAEVRDDNYFWVVEAIGSGPVGSISTHGCDRRNGTFEYGISIAREHWGKGFGREAITIVLRYMFDELRYQKAGAVVYAFNDRSRQMHESMGFQLEGRLRSVHFSGGAYHDAFLFGMTAAEFKDRYG
jgi:RimJ/RimL family protein N-acetyltransferase